MLGGTEGRNISCGSGDTLSISLPSGFGGPHQKNIPLMLADKLLPLAADDTQLPGVVGALENGSRSRSCSILGGLTSLPQHLADLCERIHVQQQWE